MMLRLKNLTRNIAVLWLAFFAIGHFGAVGLLRAASPFIQQTTSAEPATLWETIESHTTASLRGISVVDSQVFWASGSEGTVLRSVDGGKTLSNVSVPGAESLDFRDIHAFNAEQAVVISAGSPGVAYRTEDGGTTWEKTYEDLRDDIFFDAMDFWDEQHGIAFGDPMQGRLMLIRTDDGGKTWRELDETQRPETLPGEGGFAASGTCLITRGTHEVWIGTGSHLEGKTDSHTRLLFSGDRGATWSSVQVPLERTPASGVFSLCSPSENHWVVVGGDYSQPDAISGTLAISADQGATWTVPDDSVLRGYRSVVVSCQVNNRPVVFAAGTNGIDASLDLGVSWHAVGNENIHAMGASSDGQMLFAVGPQGTVYRCAAPAALATLQER